MGPTKQKHIIYFELQQHDESGRDHALHLKPDSKKVAGRLKAWSQNNLHRNQIRYDPLTRRWTISENGKFHLKKLKRAFDMVHGIPWDW